MRWSVHGERSVYDSEWVSLRLVDVEVPEGPRFEHHVVRFPREAAGTVIHDSAAGAVLLLWRHRFITDSWGYEVPAGGLDEGESPEQAAVREAVEEAGWRPRRVEPLLAYHPMPGTVDQTFHVFFADEADHVGEPTDPGESERVEWVPVAELRRAVLDGRITEGLSLTGLLAALGTGRLG